MYEKFFDELKTLRDERETICNKVKTDGRPVIIFGSGNMAKFAAKELNSFGVEVTGFAVDEKYFQPNKNFLDLPVYNYAELLTQADKYVFVLGMNSDFVDSDRSLEFLQDKRITSYMICPDASRFIDRNFILDHKDEFANTFDLLEDDLSRQTLAAYLRLMVTFDYSQMFDIFRRGFYFNALTESVKGGIFVDCGAYRGDTLERFINWSGGHYEKIFAIEADKKNFAVLEKTVRDNSYKNVFLINCGLWNEKGTLSFNSSGDVLSAFSDSAINYEASGVVETIPVDTLDNIIGDEPIDFVKLMIQGSELNALQGATNIMERQQPLWAIAVHQNPYALITIPQFIKSFGDSYKIYLRRHCRFAISGLILYAIAKN